MPPLTVTPGDLPSSPLPQVPLSLLVPPLLSVVPLVPLLLPPPQLWLWPLPPPPLPLEAEPPLLVEPALPEDMPSTEPDLLLMEPDLPSTEPDLLSVLVVLTVLATALAMVLD